MITRNTHRARHLRREYKRLYGHLGVSAYDNLMGGIIRLNEWDFGCGWGLKRGSMLARYRLNAIKQDGLVSPFVEWCNRVQSLGLA